MDIILLNIIMQKKHPTRLVFALVIYYKCAIGQNIKRENSEHKQEVLFGGLKNDINDNK